MAEKNFENEFAALDLAVENLKTAASKAKIVPAIVVTPADGFTIPFGGSLQFHASGPYVWSVSGAQVSVAGLVTASDKAGQIKVTARLTDGGESATSSGSTVAPNAVLIQPGDKNL